MKYAMSMLLGAALSVMPLQAEPKYESRIEGIRTRFDKGLYSQTSTKRTTIPIGFFGEEKPLDEKYFMSKKSNISTIRTTSSLEAMIPTTESQCTSNLVTEVYNSVSEHTPTTGTVGSDEEQARLYGSVSEHAPTTGTAGDEEEQAELYGSKKELKKTSKTSFEIFIEKIRSKLGRN